MVKVLTEEEEKFLISELLKSDWDDTPSCGSSRAVIPLPTDVQKTLSEAWNGVFDAATSYVVKVSIGVGGYVQSMNEISAYLNLPSVCPFASIVAYGQYCEIMEQVDLSERDDLPDWDDFRNPYFALWDMYRFDRLKMYETLKKANLITFIEPSREDASDDANKENKENEETTADTNKYILYKGSYVKLSEVTTDGAKYNLFERALRNDEELAEEYFNRYWDLCSTEEKQEQQRLIKSIIDFNQAVNTLDDFLGSTGDNYQLGRNAAGKWVSYDYGFRGHNWGQTNTWSSPLTENFEDNEDEFRKYLKFLCTTLDELKVYSNTILRRRINEIKYANEIGWESDADRLYKNTDGNYDYYKEGATPEDIEELSTL